MATAILAAAIGTLILNFILAVYLLVRHWYLTREDENSRK